MGSNWRYLSLSLFKEGGREGPPYVNEETRLRALFLGGKTTPKCLPLISGSCAAWLGEKRKGREKERGHVLGNS